MTHVCNPSYSGDIGGRSWFKAGPRPKAQDRILKVTKAKKKKRWWHGSSRAPT
jgi:hypothetical protein